MKAEANVWRAKWRCGSKVEHLASPWFNVLVAALARGAGSGRWRKCGPHSRPWHADDINEVGEVDVDAKEAAAWVGAGNDSMCFQASRIHSCMTLSGTLSPLGGPC